MLLCLDPLIISIHLTSLQRTLKTRPSLDLLLSRKVFLETTDVAVHMCPLFASLGLRLGLVGIDNLLHQLIARIELLKLDSDSGCVQLNNVFGQ